MDFKGKTAIVTGTSKGIGLATTKLLLEEGVKVLGWSRSEPDVEHDHYFHFETDVTDVASVENSYVKSINDHGKEISFLINNAGIGYEYPLEETPLELWHKMFRTNVDGIFYCSRLVIPEMKKLSEGHIINISSVAGTTGIPNMAAYCGTKHAVKGISHSLFRELRNFGIKVTCIYPGSVNTNFFDPIPSVDPNENMMSPVDVAGTILHCLKSDPNYHHVDIEVRPLMLKGKK